LVYLLTIRRVGDFFALLISACSTVTAQKLTRGHKKGISQMAPRQTEITYLKAVLLWLQEYWNQ
jgi:hypothetical protein